MNSKDILDVSMQMADLASKLLQFLVVGTIAIIGWVLTGKGLILSDVASSDRIIFALIYALFFIGLWATYNRLIIRVQAGLRIAYANSADDLKSSLDFKTFTAPFEAWVASWLLPVIGLSVCVIIVFWPSAS